MQKKILIFDPANPIPAPEWRNYNGIDFELAPLLATDLRRIRKEVADLKLDDVAAAAELEARLSDHIIRDWRGPVTPDRVKLPLVKINKFGLVNALPELKDWMRMESDKIAGDQMFKVEEELKNSEGSLAGSPGALEEKMGDQ